MDSDPTNFQDSEADLPEWARYKPEQDDYDRPVKKPDNRIRFYSMIGLGVLLFATLFDIAYLSYKNYVLGSVPSPAVVVRTLTFVPSITPTSTESISTALPISLTVTAGSNVVMGKNTTKGEAIDTGNFSMRIGIDVDGTGQNRGTVTWFTDSSGIIKYLNSLVNLVLKKGAIYAQFDAAEFQVNFLQSGVIAKIQNGKMVVKTDGTQITVFCFEGICQINNGLPEPHLVSVGTSLAYDLIGNQFGELETITDQQRVSLNVLCFDCLNGLNMPAFSPTSEASITPTLTPTAKKTPYFLPTITKKPRNKPDGKPGPTCDPNGPIQC